MAVTFDGATKIIQVDSGVTSVDVRNVYSLWKQWVQTSDNAKWESAFRVTGGDPIGGSLYSPIFLFLINGWTIRPDDTSGSHELTVSLNLYADPDTADRFTPVSGVVISNKTSDAVVINFDILDPATFQLNVAEAVWEAVAADHETSDTTGERLKQVKDKAGLAVALSA